MRHHDGFTLFEVSIVLTIIALIIGGIIAGRSMIRESEVRSEINRLTKYETAFNLFRTKYNAIPGDMSQAQIAEIPSVTSSHYGDGDGKINSTAESVYVWEHLSKAGFIEGNYNGILDSHPAPIGPVYGCDSGITCPASPFSNIKTVHWISGMKTLASNLSIGSLYGSPLINSDMNMGIFIINADNYAGVMQTSGIEQDEQKNGLPFISEAYAMPGSAPYTPTVTLVTDGIEALYVDQAADIDAKMDDGVASTGRVLTINRGLAATNCVNGAYNSAAGVTYNMSDTASDCFTAYVFQ